MPEALYFRRLATELRRRAARAAVSQVGPACDGLRRHLLSTLDSPPGDKLSFLAPPVFEALFEWEPDAAPLRDVPFLHDDLKDALAHPSAAYAEEAFPLDRHPYVHQRKAWRELIEVEKQSVVVTTGTASGKTECFLVPILNDLAVERAESGKNSPLVGVRALFLYPLNALINSQRERLLAWTSAFGDQVRFCLYNGNTPEHPPKGREQSKTPSEVLSRKALRFQPPPILVTNATMLEFMMVRAIDAPIVEQSEGKLRWIVLDEAHTYLGSSAAELSLLLRRVMHAFRVSPDDVRFVATSATIGGKGAKKQLQRFLADLAGIGTDRVTVIDGRRVMPELGQHLVERDKPVPELGALAAQTDTEAFESLASSASVRELRAELAGGHGALPRVQSLPGYESAEDALELLDHASRAVSPDGQFLLPLRGHYFLRTVTGLWACTNPACDGIAGTPLQGSDWPFGMVYRERRTHCAVCKSAVFEAISCHGCGETYLVTRSENGHLHPCSWNADAGLDDAEADEGDDDDDDQDIAASVTLMPTLLAGPEGAAKDEQTGVPTSSIPYDPATGVLGSGPSHVHLVTHHNDHYRCGRCGSVDRRDGRYLRSVRLGAQFFLGLGIPAVLEQLPKRRRTPREEVESPLPANGRRLITFTDSRQGTARFALRSQLEAERNYVRASVYHHLWQSATPADEALLEKKRAKLKKLEGLAGDPTFDEIIRDAAAELAKLEEKATTGSMGWRDLESKLAHELPIRSWMPQGMKSRYAAANLSAQEMAQVCLLRELVRRPKRQTSLETLGLVRLAYPALDTVEIVPAAWKQLAPRIAGDPLEKWRELLAVLLDFFVRSLSAVQILNTDFRRWLGARVNQPLIVRQDEPSVKNRQYPWPGVPAKGTWPRMSRLLAKALALDPSERADRELVHELMGEAFKSLLHANALAQFEGGYRLELSSTRLETVAKGNLCPVTRRVLGRTLLGLSPFQPPSWASQAKCEEVALPRPRYVMRRDVHTGELVEPPVIQEWLESDATVRALREKGVWTEFSDRIASFPDTLYYESAEHSAQVSKARLQQLEKSFKDGRTNLLSCSTTMEMGVDIGGLSAVGMNNAPPGPANYQQRAGRAGRRGENRATVLTLCQGSPHGAAVFANPAWPFTHPVHVPQVSLSSERIVQRHVHSVLLGSYFVQVGAKDTHRLRCQDFFLSKSEGVASAHQDYLRWLQDEAMADEHVKDGVAGVVRGTPLQGPVGPRLDVARQQLQRAATRWKAEHGALMSDLERLGGEPTKEDKGSPAQRAVYAQVRRLREEYLLKTLASEGYLPSYGFPLQVVPFVTTTAEGMKAAKAAGVGRDEGYQRARGFPSRQVDRGIIDYAPGSGVIIDGTVYESRGVTLNWQLQTAGGDYREVQSLRHAWKCRECGAAGDSVRAPKACVQCGAERPRPHRYLEPAGFAVDIRHRPTNDLSKERYIAKREPWISAGGAAWQLFANPRSGWFRYDPDGYVHHNSAGEAGFGYAICLHCGYAESHSDNSLDLTKSFKQHRRLRGGGESGELCDGATGGWGVVTGIRLGASTRTDVIEIQLVDPTSGDSIDNPSVATSIAVALRQALATKLGVDPREIGWTLSRSRGLGTQARGSIVLFDAANGGAGYVSAVAADLGSLLESAKALLKCPEDCDAACHACLLAYDTQFAVDLLDRHAAIEALSDDVLSALRLPKELEYFGPDSKLETLSLRSALYLQGQKAGLTAIRAHLGGPVEDWDYDAWTLRRTLWELNHDGVDVTVVIPERAHQKLEFDEANQLAGRLEADGFRVELAKGSGTQVADGWLILEAQGAQRSIRWATSHPVGLVPDEDWAGPGDETQQARYVVCRSDGPLPDLSAKSVEPKALRKPIPSHFVEVRIFDELDGPIADVGSKFWDRFAKKYPDLDARLYGSTQLASVLYTDCYVCKPLTGRVLYEVLRALKSFSGGLAEFTQLSLITSWSSHPNYPGQIFDDWDDRSLQSETLGSLLDALGAKANPVQLMSRSTLPHHRELVLTWTDGHKIRLRLDSGLGFFFANPSVPLDFRKPAADHAADITSATLSVRANERYSVTKMPVYLSSEAGG